MSGTTEEEGWLKPVKEWTDYVTRRAHGAHPAGTACQARRGEDGLELRFPDGEVLLNDKWYAEGIEGENPDRHWYEPMLTALTEEYGLSLDGLAEEFLKFRFMLMLRQAGNPPVDGLLLGDRLLVLKDAKVGEGVAQWALEWSSKENPRFLYGSRLVTTDEDAAHAQMGAVVAVEEIKDATDRKAEEG